MIATLFGKKRISEEKLANAFVNGVLGLTEQGYPMIVEELQDAPEFQDVPVFGPGDDDLFALIVLAGNLMDAPKHLPAGQDRRFFSHTISKFAQAMGQIASELETEVISLQHYMSRINHPSKNTVGAMSQAVFHKFDLFHCQNAFFREQKAPNPIVLRRLHNLMNYFLWDWAEITEEYRITA
jgi:hypothetical protein